MSTELHVESLVLRGARNEAFTPTSTCTWRTPGSPWAS